jgi:hypothetical protein
VSLFDKQSNYVIELLIPLKYLGLSIEKTSKIAYDIILNGSSKAEGAIIEDIEGGTRVVSSTGTTPPISDMMYTRAPSNFGAIYKFAK